MQGIRKATIDNSPPGIPLPNARIHPKARKAPARETINDMAYTDRNGLFLIYSKRGIRENHANNGNNLNMTQSYDGNERNIRMTLRRKYFPRNRFFAISNFNVFPFPAFSFFKIYLSVI